MEIFGYQIPLIFGFHVPKIAIVISLGIAAYYIAVFMMRVGMSGVGGMFMVGRDVAAPGETPKRPMKTSAGSGASVAFNRSAVIASGLAWEDFEPVDAALTALQARKKATLPRQGPLLTSKGAWFVAVLEQAVLYRIVALTGGAITLWEARNPLGAVLSARSLLESGALVLEMERQLNELAEAGKAAEIDAYVAERAFVSQAGGWIEQARAARPVDTLRVIDAADRASPGLRFCYDRLSEIAAPEALGQLAVYGATDKSGTAAEFSDIESLEPSTFRLILNAARILVLVAAALESIDSLVTRVAVLETA